MSPKLIFAVHFYSHQTTNVPTVQLLAVALWKLDWLQVSRRWVLTNMSPPEGKHQREYRRVACCYKHNSITFSTLVGERDGHRMMTFIHKVFFVCLFVAPKELKPTQSSRVSGTMAKLNKLTWVSGKACILSCVGNQGI